MRTPPAVEKPWGYEVWLELNDRYCMKKIFIRGGHRTSLQYHRVKLETNCIAAGEAEVWCQQPSGEITREIAGPGRSFTFAPGQIHRIAALSDLTVFEVSTPEVDDVVRVEDDTGRADGRIEAEHVAATPLRR